MGDSYVSYDRKTNCSAESIAVGVDAGAPVPNEPPRRRILQQPSVCPSCFVTWWSRFKSGYLFGRAILRGKQKRTMAADGRGKLRSEVEKVGNVYVAVYT